MNWRRVLITFYWMAFLMSAGSASAQRCSGQMHFRLYDHGVVMEPSTATRMIYERRKVTLRPFGLQIRTFSKDDRSGKALGQKPGEDLLYVDLTCAKTWRMVIRKKDKQARRFIEMEIRFQESCDAFLYLDIDFQPGVFELALCPDSVLRPEGGQAPRNQHGIIVTPASWSLRKRN
jgi:hypothetical protein